MELSLEQRATQRNDDDPRLARVASSRAPAAQFEKSLLAWSVRSFREYALGLPGSRERSSDSDTHGRCQSSMVDRMSHGSKQVSPSDPSQTAASATGKVRVYIASSFDGFIAGPNDDLSWLPGADPNATPTRGDVQHGVSAPGSVEYTDFMARVGALLMGRRTFDVVLGFGGDWPFGDRPVLVATHQPLATSIPSVEPVAGTIQELVARAKERAGNEDVYLDGGNLIRQALSAGLVDDLIVTLVPELLGQGQPLFAGLAGRYSLEFTGCYPFGAGMLQIHARPRGR